MGAKTEADKSPETEYIAENRYIDETTDVAIVRHIRCFPSEYGAHNFFEMMYMEQGKCVSRTDGMELSLQEGDICVIPPRTDHAISDCSEDAVIVDFLIRSSTFESAFWDLLQGKDILAAFFAQSLYGGKSDSVLVFHAEGDEILKKFVEYACDEYQGNQGYRNRMLNNLIRAIFILILRNHEKDVEIPARPGEIQDENLMDILNYIQEHYMDLTLSGLAGYFNYSERHMSRLLKEKTGLNFRVILQKLKLGKAADLLHNPNITLQDIVEQAGYMDISSFVRTFKKYYGMSPAEYRQIHAEK